MSKWVICRICLKLPSDDVISIRESNRMQNMVKHIEEYGGISLDADSEYELPDKMCDQCFTLLKAAVKFRYLCQRSQERFSKIMQQDLKSTLKKNYSPHKVKKNVSLTELKSRLNFDEPHKNDSPSDGDTGKSIVVIDEEICVESPNSVDQFYKSEYINIQPCDQGQYLHDESEDQLESVDEHLIDNNENSKASSDNDELEYVLLQPSPKHTENVNDKRKLESSYSPQVTVKKHTHSKDETKLQSFICSYCGNIYKGRSQFTLHMKRHNQDKPHECEICQKRFAQTPQLARHMNSHTGNRPYKCQFCNSCFADPSTRIKHQRIHTQERPFKCEVCTKAFSYSNVLKVHMMTHTGEKPFSCKFCEKKFGQLHHKKTHERMHSDELAAISK